LLRDGVACFLEFAAEHPEIPFVVTRVGCGLAGFADTEVAPLFSEAPENCLLPGIWRKDFRALIVAGSRGIGEREVLAELGAAISPNYRGEVVSGMARGVDRAAVTWARRRNLPLVEAPALWDRYGKQAGVLRNHWMAWYGTHLFAVWDGQSRGTWNMIHVARENRLKVLVAKSVQGLE
jgi:hypothetical protein